MRFCAHDCPAVVECGPAVGGPRHFEHAIGAPDTLHSQTVTKTSAGCQVVHELGYGSQEGCLLAGRECIKIETITASVAVWWSSSVR